ncbi:MAG: 30S ribosomal protein S6e [Candidatus Aenigmarchaeota archaeon]|nr:30S ribosomal protein S6e [Candidatus Aenigmarchaeota archaeon]
MTSFKFVISDGARSVQVEKDQKDCPVLGKKIGESIPGDFLGLVGYELSIRGGHDNSGFPMLKNVNGAVKKELLLTKGKGFDARLKRKKKLMDAKKGLRKRKTIRGNAISLETSQINCKVMKQGTKPFAELFPVKTSEPSEQDKSEASKD